MKFLLVAAGVLRRVMACKAVVELLCAVAELCAAALRRGRTE
jgi:hypothetical protein